MRNTLTYSYLLRLIKQGKQPEKVVFVDDLETYKWDGMNYVGVNNGMKLIEVMLEFYEEAQLASLKLLDRK